MAVTVLALVASAYWAGRDRGFRYGQISGAKDADSKWQAVQQAAEVKHREEMDQERQRSHDWVQAGHKDAEEYITNRAIQLQQFYGRLIPRTNQETKK